MVPTTSYGALGRVLPLLPSGALGDAMRAAFLDGRIGWSHLVVLLVWALVGAALTARTFAWE